MKWIIIVAICLITACEEDRRQIAEREQKKDAHLSEVIKNMRYARDPDTGLCFAISDKWRGGYMAHVPSEHCEES